MMRFGSTSFGLMAALVIGFAALNPTTGDAADRKTTKLAGEIVVDCVNNLKSQKKIRRLLKGRGFSELDPVEDVQGYLAPNEKLFVVLPYKSPQFSYCNVSVKNLPLGEANAIGKVFAEKIGLKRTTADDKAISRIWSGAGNGHATFLMVKRKEDNGLFKGPAIAVLRTKNQ